MREGLRSSPPREAIDQSGGPAVAYGAHAVNIHVTDEAAGQASIMSGARTLARFTAWFFANGGR